MGEIGWKIENKIVNFDSAYYQEKLSLLYLSGFNFFFENEKKK